MIPKPVKSGDIVLAAWNAVLKAMTSLTILPGKGILLTRSPQGTVINSRQAIKGFTGAWAVTAGTNSLKVARGFVNAVEPLVGGFKISDSNAEIPFKDFVDGRLWVGIKVKVDPETGRMKEKDATERDITVVVQGSPKSTDALIGFHPIALLTQKPVLRVHQIAFFDYQHSTARKPTGKGFRHFFHVA